MEILLIAVGIIVAVFVAWLGAFFGPLLIFLSVIALVLSFLGFLIFEESSFSFEKPLLGIAAGIAWTIAGAIVRAIVDKISRK